MTTLSTNQSAADLMAEWEASNEPLRANDGLSFDELAVRYNFLKASNRRFTVVRMITDEIKKRPGPTRVLDIGAGEGIRRKSLQKTIITRSPAVSTRQGGSIQSPGTPGWDSASMFIWRATACAHTCGARSDRFFT